MKLPIGTEVVLIKDYDPYHNVYIPIGTLRVVGGTNEGLSIYGIYTSVIWDFDFEDEFCNNDNQNAGLLMAPDEIDTVL